MIINSLNWENVKLKDGEQKENLQRELLIVIPNPNTHTRKFLEFVQAEQTQSLSQEEKGAIERLKNTHPNCYAIKVNLENYSQNLF